MIADDLLFVASVLEHGDAEPHAQKIASRRLQQLVPVIRRMERALDEIVSEAQDEEHLLMRPPAPPVTVVRVSKIGPLVSRKSSGFPLVCQVVPFRRLLLVRAVGEES